MENCRGTVTNISGGVGSVTTIGGIVE